MTKTPEKLYFERMMQEYTTRWEGCPYVLGSIKGITALSLANCDGYEAGYNAAWDEWRAGKLFQNQEHADAVYKEAAEDHLSDADKAMNSPEKQDSWISVKERLPKIPENDRSDRVLLLRADRFIVIARIEKCVRFMRPFQEALIVETDNGDPIEEFTHWMPLPEAPKDE